MKVYIIIDHDGGRPTDSVYGVYTSRELAENWIKECEWLSDDEKDFLYIVEEELIGE